MNDKPSLLTRLFGGTTSPQAKTKAGQFGEGQKVTESSPSKLSAGAFEQTFQLNQLQRLTTVVDNINMARLKDIFSTAESGRINELIDIYMRMEASDARLAGMLNMRRQAAARANHVLSHDQNNPRAAAAAELVEENISRLNWKNFLRAMMDGKIYGVAMFEKIWARLPDNRLMISNIEQIDHTRIEQYNLFPQSDRYGELSIVEGLYSGNRIFLDEVDPYKLIVAKDSEKKGQYDLAGAMRPIARWYVLKTFLVKAWAQYAEVYGFPVPIVKVSEQEYQNNKSLIKKLLESVGVNRYGIFFDTMEYELKQAGGSASIDVFKKYLDFCNTEMAIGVLGQNLTTEIQGGSRAASETHMEVMNAITEDDIEWLDEIIQHQFVDEIVRVNFPNLPLEEYPVYKSVLAKNIDLQKLGLGLQTISRLVPISTSYIYEQAQIPVPDEGEETIGGSDELMNTLANDTN